MNNQDQTRRDRQARDIFLCAVEIQSAEAQSAYLDGACRQDDSLRSRVDALLKSHKQDSFLETAAVEAGTVLSNPTLISEGPGTVIDRYKLLQKLGEGGFGVVYMAEQKEPVKRRVALKIIKLGMDTEQVVARFEAERQALAMMDHPNIAKVFDAGATDTGRPYFVMELVKGVPITKYCDDNQLTTKERLNLFIQVCQAVQHAHQKGIIHRDLKPSNIMITLHDGVPVPKVIDFGIAKATQQELTEKTIFTQYSQFIGTPAYMSPEQAEMSGLDIDTRSDIYSLGVVLYELLVGRTPLDAEELLSGGYDEIRRRIKEEEPPKPSTRASTLEGAEKTSVAKHRKLNPGQLSNELRGDLDWIVLKALEKDRTRRYETANGFAVDLKRYLGNEPVAAVAPSTAYLLKKYVRRHRAPLAVAAAIVVLLLLGTTISTWQAVRATQAKRSAEDSNRAAQIERERAQTAQAQAESSQQAEKQQRQLVELERTEALHLLYVANMNLAQQAWDQNNVRRVRQLLDETATYPDRGFEWYYWQRQTHLELRTLRGHSGSISAVAYSPDGQRIVTGSWDNTAKVWEAASGKELLTLKGHKQEIWAVAFSPDGQRIVTAGSDWTAMVWDAATGKELLTLKGHSDGIRSVAFSPDGHRIVTGSLDKTAKVWETASGKELLEFRGHKDAINSVAFSPDGQRILTGSDDKTAKVWEAANGKELLTLTGHSQKISGVAFSPDGQRIVTGSWDSTAKVWDAISGKELLEFRGHKDDINSVAFSPDGQRILTGSDDTTAKVWEAASGKELLTLKGHSARVRSVAFSPDGERIVTGGLDWQTTSEYVAKVWDATSSKEVLTIAGHKDLINSVAYSPDGQRIVTGSTDKTAKVWDATRGNELVTLEGHIDQVLSAAFSPDGHRIVTGSSDETAKVWEALSGKELFSLEGHKGPIWSAAFSPDGRRIVTGSFDHTAKVWDAASGEELLTLKGHVGWIWSVAYSPDGQRIVTGSDDKTAKIWDAATGKKLHTFRGHTTYIISVAFSPDGKQIATGSGDSTVKVWEVATGKELLTLSGHSGQVWAVGFSRDGQRIVTGSEDKTAKVWEATSGKELLTLKGHSGKIRSVAFSPDGQRIVTGSEDRTAKVWEAATTNQVAAWEAEERQAEERLAAREQEDAVALKREEARRKQDPGCIKQWLVLAPVPFPGETEQALADALDREQIPNEGSLRPCDGQRVTVDGEEYVWKAVELPDYVIDFNKFVGKKTDWSLAYAVCYVMSDAPQTGGSVEIGSDAAAIVYLNGNRIYRGQRLRSYVADLDVVSNQELKAGLNVLVFKVANGTLDWKGSIRFTDAAGNPVKGLQVKLQP